MTAAVQTLPQGVARHLVLKRSSPCPLQADIGIAVANATDAARAAADIVLTEPGLGVIVDAVIGARKIFQRMKNYAKYTIAMTFRICFTFGARPQTL